MSLCPASCSHQLSRGKLHGYFYPIWGSGLNPRPLAFSPALFGGKYCDFKSVCMESHQRWQQFLTPRSFLPSAVVPLQAGVPGCIGPRHFISLTQPLMFSLEVLTLIKLNLELFLTPQNSKTGQEAEWQGPREWLSSDFMCSSCNPWVILWGFILVLASDCLLQENFSRRRAGDLPEL